jgi:hypothetical protein
METTRRKARSKSAPSGAEKSNASRAAIHKEASMASGRPCDGKRPVQSGIALSMKPATAAAA